MVERKKPKKRNLKAWIGQDPKQVAKHGSQRASWYVFWNWQGRRHAKSCGPGQAGERLAKKECQRIHAEIIVGMYEDLQRQSWQEFRREFERVKFKKIRNLTTQQQIRFALNEFEKAVNPTSVDAINSKTIAEFVAYRLDAGGKRSKSKVSAATVNRDLRNLRRVLRTAAEWGYLRQMPKIEFEREPSKLIRFVTQEHFEAIYAACSTATEPTFGNLTAGDWWRSLLVFLYMTGWRVSEALALRWSDVDLKAGTAITRAKDNKGKRDECCPLHPLIVDHLESIRGFRDFVFPFDKYRWSLYPRFHAIQRSAGINLPCAGEHEHTPSCHVYGFHDLRRAFASLNAGTLSASELQTLMRHRSFTTTQRYMNMAPALKGVTAKLHTPTLVRESGGGMQVG